MVLFALGRSPSVFLKFTFSYMNTIFLCNIILRSHPQGPLEDTQPARFTNSLCFGIPPSNCGGERGSLGAHLPRGPVGPGMANL